VEGGGRSAGAGRVCANPDKGTPVDIGDTSRDWKASDLLNEAETLLDTVPFVQFGLEIKELVATTGYVVIPADDTEKMLHRLVKAPATTVTRSRQELL